MVGGTGEEDTEMREWLDSTAQIQDVILICSVFVIFLLLIGGVVEYFKGNQNGRR